MHGCRQPQQSATPARRPEDPVGDADRRRHVDLAERAFADGLLEVTALERMLERILRARTAGDLEAAIAPLPEGWLTALQRAEAAEARAAADRTALLGEVRAYLGVITLLVGIWLVTAVAAGASHFWPIWPALGWGLPLLGRWRSGRQAHGRRRRDPELPGVGG